MAHDPRSVLTRAAAPPNLALWYADGPDHAVDVWLPPPAAERPALVIFFHGGFWRRQYDRTHVAPLAADLAGRGYVVATPEYRRTGAPGGGWPGTFDDVAAAVRVIPGQVAAHTAVDLSRLVVAGHSAGGHLALWAAEAGHLSPPGRVVGLAPVADLQLAYQLDLDSGAVRALLGARARREPERYRQADPMARLPLGVPAWLVHGDQDQQVPVGLSVRFAAAAGAAGDAVHLQVLPAVEHFGVIDPQSAAWPAVLTAFAQATTPDR